MFGPNVARTLNIDVAFHHRERCFFEIVDECETLFRRKFSVNTNYRVLFVTGSGTLATEAFIASIQRTFHVVGSGGDFKERLRRMCAHYGKHDPFTGNLAYCRLETSNSQVNDLEGGFFVDCVSSFPYYSAPVDAQAWVTVSSKQLGAGPVLGILVFHNSLLEEMMHEDSFSYLNVRRMAQFAARSQTPHTPAIPLFIDLRDRLRRFETAELREQINRNCELLVDALGESSFIGSIACPVLTLKQGAMPEHIARQFDLYGRHASDHPIQIFTYSEDPAQYQRLAAAVAEDRRAICAAC
jgi:aspartate aminotransferase-like enzyme